MVQRLAGGWTDGDHNTSEPRHGGQLQVFDVSILCSTQHHLHSGRPFGMRMRNPTTAEGRKEIAASYSSRWNFHHVLGALDGKHIRIRCPANVGSQFYNYKGYHSIMLLALVYAS